MLLDGPRWGPADGGAPQSLVVLLHGVGADGHDLIDLAPSWGQVVPHAAFVAPDAPEPCDFAPYGRQWFSIGDRNPARLAAGVRAAATVLDAFLDAELARLGVAPEKLLLMGFSQGCMTALFTGLRRRVAPAGILGYSGALLAAEAIGEITQRPPVLLVHGEEDEVVPVEATRMAEATLRAASVPVEAMYCPRLGHGLDDAGLSAGSLFLQRYLGAT